MVKMKLFKDGKALLKLSSPQSQDAPGDGLTGNDRMTEYTPQHPNLLFQAA